MYFTMGHIGSKTWSLGQTLEKPIVRSRGQISVQLSQNVVRMFVLMKSRTNSTIGNVRSKTRSPGQILEKSCVCSRCHIFSPIIIQLGQNVCLDEILDEFENLSCRVKN